MNGWPTKEDMECLEKACRRCLREIEKIEKGFSRGYPSTSEEHMITNKKWLKIYEEGYKEISHLGFSVKDWSNALKRCKGFCEDSDLNPA